MMLEINLFFLCIVVGMAFISNGINMSTGLKYITYVNLAGIIKFNDLMCSVRESNQFLSLYHYGHSKLLNRA